MSAGRAKQLALMGCGLWGRNILRDLVALNCRVIVVDPSVENRRVATQIGAISVLDDGAQLPDVEGIVVATPASTHISVVEKYLDRQVPIFCEKPLATDPAAVEQLRPKADELLFEMHIWRYHPGVEKLAELARDETLGQVEWLKTSRTNWTSPRKDVDPIWTLAPHDLSIVYEILGYLPTPVSAVAEFAGGQPVGMVGILKDRVNVVVEVSTRYAEKRREIRMHCTRGVAILPDDRTDHIKVSESNPNVPDTATTRAIPINMDPPLLRELQAFLNYLDGGTKPLSSITESLGIISALSQLRQLAGIPPDGPH